MYFRFLDIKNIYLFIRWNFAKWYEVLCYIFHGLNRKQFFKKLF